MSGAGKGSVYRPVNVAAWDAGYSRIDFSTLRKEREASQKQASESDEQKKATPDEKPSP